MFRKFGIVSIVTIFAFAVNAQETLPSFTLINKGNHRIICSWTNPYGDGIKQLTIQRSSDSLKNFKSILTLPDPTVPQNGYVDTKAPEEQMFYRIYIQLDSGKYIFSPAKRPFVDSARRVPMRPPAEIKPAEEPRKPEVEEPKKPVTTDPQKTVTTESKNEIKKPTTESPKIKEPVKKEIKEIVKPVEIPEKIFFIKRRDTVIAQVGEKSIKHYRDSIQYKTKDSLGLTIGDTLFIKAFIPKIIYKPSKYIFTEKDGNVKILLPDATVKKYQIKFYDENGNPLFDIKLIKDPVLILDKANFMKSGWFKFDLLEEGKIIESHKLFIPKDF
jgi:hypothetical protein